MARIRITGLPNKAHGGPTGGAADGLRKFMTSNKTFDKGLNQFAEPDFEVNTSISGVPRDEATIEAEGGETVLVPGEGGLPEFYKINGKRHGPGGVPLNVPKESFVFSDFKKGKGSMQIKDKEILAQFGININKKGKQKGRKMLFLEVEDDTAVLDSVVVFPDSIVGNEPWLINGGTVLLRGERDNKYNKDSFIVENVIPI